MIPYEDIPTEYRMGNNKWNKLAHHVLDKGCEQVNLTPRHGKTPQQCDTAWANALDLWRYPDMSEIHRVALMAWILASTFEDIKYDFDGV
jgi:hypothetical protein